MYFVKLTSPVRVVEVISAVEKISITLNLDPVKLEKVLLKGEAIVARATTLEKAKSLASVFRSAGVKISILHK